MRSPRFMGVCALVICPAIALAQDAAATGIVEVTSSVPGSQVYIDNELVGEAPLTQYLPPGDHMVRVTADDHDPFVRRVTVLEESTEIVDATLVDGGGTVEFIVTPAGAELSIADEEWPTPVRLSTIRPGTHTYTLRAPAHETVSGTLEFYDGQNVLIVEDLEPSAGLLVVTSEPSGASVWIDDEQAGSTPLRLRDLTPGQHTARFASEGRAVVVEPFSNLDPETKTTVDAFLPEDGVPLSVRAGSSDAAVFLEGAQVGAGSSLSLAVVANSRHTVRVEAPGQASAERTVDVGSRPVRLKARLGASSSSLVEVPPLHKRPLVLGGAGAVVVGGVVTAVVLASRAGGDDGPQPDVIVTLP